MSTLLARSGHLGAASHPGSRSPRRRPRPCRSRSCLSLPGRCVSSFARVDPPGATIVARCWPVEAGRCRFVVPPESADPPGATIVARCWPVEAGRCRCIVPPESADECPSSIRASDSRRPPVSDVPRPSSRAQETSEVWTEIGVGPDPRAPPLGPLNLTPVPREAAATLPPLALVFDATEMHRGVASRLVSRGFPVAWHSNNPDSTRPLRGTRAHPSPRRRDRRLSPPRRVPRGGRSAPSRHRPRGTRRRACPRGARRRPSRVRSRSPPLGRIRLPSRRVLRRRFGPRRRRPRRRCPPQPARRRPRRRRRRRDGDGARTSPRRRTRVFLRVRRP